MRTFDEAAEVPAGAAHSRTVVTYLNCPRCGLSIELRAHWLTIQHCPRCIARAHMAVDLFSSALPLDALYTKGDHDDGNSLVGHG